MGAGTAAADVTTSTYDQPWGVGNVGQLSAITNAAGTIGYAYDAAGRLVYRTNYVDGTGYGFSWAYDVGGRLLSRIFPDGDSVGGYVYDLAGRLKSVTGDSLEPEALKALGEVVPYLRTCAEAKRSEPVYAPPVGNVAMYTRRLFGGVTALTTSPGHAAMTLGKMYETGRGVPRDLEVARQHYRSAVEVHGFEEARERLRGL